MSSFYYKDMCVLQQYIHTYEYYSSSDQYITFWELKRILGFLIKSYCSAQEQKSRFAFHLCRKVIEHPVTLHKFYYNFMLEEYQEILVVSLDDSKMILWFFDPLSSGEPSFNTQWLRLFSQFAKSNKTLTWSIPILLSIVLEKSILANWASNCKDKMDESTEQRFSWKKESDQQSKLLQIGDIFFSGLTPFSFHVDIFCL